MNPLIEFSEDMSNVKQTYQTKVGVQGIKKILSVKKKYRELILQKRAIYSVEEVDKILKVVKGMFNSYLLKRPYEDFVRICAMMNGCQVKIELWTKNSIPLYMTTQTWKKC